MFLRIVACKLISCDGKCKSYAKEKGWKSFYPASATRIYSMTFNKSILDMSVSPLVRFWLIMTLNIISVVQKRVMKVKAQSWLLLLHQVALTPESGFINLSRNCSAENFTRITMTYLISVNFFRFLRFNVTFKWKLFFFFMKVFF